MAHEIDHPHDRLFRAVFSDAAEAAGLLRAALPAGFRDRVDWETLNLLEGTFLDDALRESESDLLYEAAYGEDTERIWLYLLFEHQSTSDAWMRFRLLKYCCRIWDAGLRDEAGRPGLRPIVPVVFHQGGGAWRHSTEFADLFPAAVRGWPWVPRFEHVLVDQTSLGPEGVEGGVKGRIAQLLMMAAYGRHAGLAMDAAARLLAALFSGGGVNYIRLFMVYVMATQDEAGALAFDEALRRRGREQGGEIMSYARQLLEEGRAEGRSQGREEGRGQGLAEGAQRGKVEVVEGFLRVGVTWDVIEAATGLNEAGFRTLKERLSAFDGPRGEQEP